MTTVLMVRHGESDANIKNIFAGAKFDPPLTENGIEQAERCAEWLVNNYKIDKVYTSPLLRARMTGGCCAHLLNIDAETREGLSEIYAGEWEGMTFSDIREKYPEEYNVWSYDISRCVCPGGESILEMSERVLKTLTEIADENTDKTVLIATHYTPVRAMQAYLQTGNFENIQKIGHIPNTSVSELFYDGKWHAGRFNMCDHIMKK